MAASINPAGVVLLDDARLGAGGKTRLSGMWLLEHQWKLVTDDYQQIYLRA
jgi:hypothetical protein